MLASDRLVQTICGLYLAFNNRLDWFKIFEQKSILIFVELPRYSLLATPSAFLVQNVFEVNTNIFLPHCLLLNVKKFLRVADVGLREGNIIENRHSANRRVQRLRKRRAIKLPV